jgi:SAM-dependent methyltransferase
MGDLNQFNLVKRNADLVRGPILEVGSKDYGSTPDFRSLFPGVQYVGVDMEAGKGVDVVLDLTGDFERIDAQLGGLRFSTVICFSVLEHCRNPFKMSENITRLLRNDGSAFISVPFSWQVHAYPSDYWRFTADGVRVLFPDLTFDDNRSCMSTSETDEFKPIDEFMYRAELSVSSALRRGEYGFARSLLVRLVRRLRIFPFIFDYRYLHPPVMVNMVGSKRIAGPDSK